MRIPFLIASTLASVVGAVIPWVVTRFANPQFVENFMRNQQSAADYFNVIAVPILSCVLTLLSFWLLEKSGIGQSVQVSTADSSSGAAAPLAWIPLLAAVATIIVTAVLGGPQMEYGLLALAYAWIILGWLYQLLLVNRKKPKI